MLHLAWQGVRRNPGRYIATLVAIITGVAFFAATGFLADRVISSLEGDVNREYGNVDAVIVADDKGAAADFADELRISGASAERIAAVDGVAATGGVLTGSVAFRGNGNDTFGDDATGRLWIEDDALNPFEVIDGTAPAAAGEITVDRGLADDHDLSVGKRVKLLTLAGQFDAEIVGITKFGDSDSIDGGGTVSIPAATAFDWLSSGQREYQELYLRGSVSQDELVSAVEPVVPSGFRAQTGESFISDKRDELGAPGRYLKYALQGFAILAMLVGAFVIYNTFSVIVSQRLHELAVMAAIGATPKQIKRSLRYEGLVLGAMGSMIGVVVGFLLTFVLVAILKAAGVELPGSGIGISPGTVVPGILLGTLITLASVGIPARRAARTEPIEALRVAAAERSPFSRRRVVITLVLVVLGAAGLLFGGSAAVGFGALAIIVGVIAAGPFIAVAWSRICRPVASLFGLEGRVAADNTARSPQRTATTANALLIGVFLVTFISVAGTSLKDFVLNEIKKVETADYVVQSTGGTIDSALVGDLESINGVDEVVAFRRESVTLDGRASQLFTGDIAALTEVAGIDTDVGTLNDVGPGTVAVVDTGDSTPALGSTVTVAASTGRSEQLKVVAIIKPSLDSQLTGNYTETSSFDELVGDTAPTVAFLDAASGAQSDTQDRIEERTALRPDITVTEGNAIGKLVGSIFDFLINAVDGLLVMSVIIALIGIINTLSLSILERRRELGLLRAVGMTDRRVRRMVRLEAVLISALGTVTGIILGLFIGWGLIYSINRLSDADISFSVPGRTLAIVLVMGIVLGGLASLVPARRSTKLDVLEAIQAT